MILSGEKREEYREIKPYYLIRLTNAAKDYEHCEGLTNDIANEICKDLMNDTPIHVLLEHHEKFRHYGTITFSNGYSKKRRQFEIELKSISVGTGNHSWGADVGRKYFVLHLGAIIHSNCS